MNTIRNFRKQTGISQDSLAGILGVSKSLIWHVEQGSRALPDSASERLTILFNLFDTREAVETIPDECISLQNKTFDKNNRKIADRIRDCQLNIYSINKRLARMKELCETSLSAFRLLDIIEADALNDEKLHPFKSWVDNHRMEMTKVYIGNNPARQAALHLRLDLLKAQEMVYSDHLKTIDSK